MRPVKFLLAIMAIALSIGARLAAAQNTEVDFYKGKTVRILVGYGPGGGYDVWARLIAPYLAKYLDANVVVENQPGAGALAALSRLYHATPDGLLIMIVNGPSAALQQLVEPEVVRFDLAKVSHLGTITSAPLVWLINAQSPIRTPEEMLKQDKPIMWPATGQIDALGDSASFTCEALKMNCRIISGYSGSNEAALAVIKSEMDAIYIDDFSADAFVKAGQLRPFAIMSRTRSRVFPDAPTVFEAAKMLPDQQWLFDFRSGVEDLGRLLIAPPDVPAARLAFLRAAVKATLSDSDLVAVGARSHNDVDFRDAEVTQKRALDAVANLTPEQKAHVKAILAYQ
jgi:tripartite-type tricarboxylate transporter receptor subunit TctC